jgi:hypothetical protein
MTHLNLVKLIFMKEMKTIKSIMIWTLTCRHRDAGEIDTLVYISGQVLILIKYKYILYNLMPTLNMNVCYFGSYNLEILRHL